MAVLNSNPEILLKKRKNADRKRIQKQDEIRQREEAKVHKATVAKDKFVRAEVLAIRNRANTLENKRIENVLKHEQRLISELKRSDDEPKLVFVIRVENQGKGKIPVKAQAVFDVLRLSEPNVGVFVKYTSKVAPALKLVSPYIVIGRPSLASVRQLFQKRACIEIENEEQEKQLVKLDNNQAVEDRFEDDLGFICIEDLVHEIVTLGENFKAVNLWIAPFKLTKPVNGWGPLGKLAKLKYAEDNKKKISLAGHARLEEIDIDKFIEEQN